MYEIGIILSILISFIYPLAIGIVFKFVKFDDKIWKYFLIAFILGILFFFIGIIRKVYLYVLSGPILYWIDLVITGFVEELMKFIAIFIMIKKLSNDVQEGPYYGLLVGLGFSAGEMLYILPSIPALVSAYENAVISNILFLIMFPNPPLSDLLWYNILVYSNVWFAFISTPNLFGLSLIALYERFIVVLFHTSTAIIIGHGFRAESPSLNISGIELTPKTIYYLMAVALHIFLDLFPVLFQLGILPFEPVEIVITVISVSCFIGAVWKYLLKS
ncbi:MAG: hypothetical protein ACTSR3_12850 [Candidatus Helarchaeota archaeon]